MSMPGGKRSRMPPRTAYSPGSRTVEARTKPLSSSHSTMPCMPMTLPGATDSACVATKSRAGTRWSAALTVVSSTERFVATAHARQPRQHRHTWCYQGRIAATRGRTAGNPRPEIPEPGSRERKMSVRGTVPPCAGRRGRRQQARLPARLCVAAIARARSASTRPSAPSATCERVSGFPGFSRSAGDFTAAITTAPLVLKLRSRRNNGVS